MGHLVNPIAMRIGWFRNWVDTYFVEFKYYPEFLHSLLRLRLYLIYFLGLKKFDKFGCFYSHFEFIKKMHILYTNIYIYVGKVEAFMESFDAVLDASRRILNKRSKVNVSREVVDFYMMLLVFRFISRFSLSTIFFKKSAHSVYKLIYLITKYNDFGVLNWLKKNVRKKNVRSSFVWRFYFFFNLFKNFKQITLGTSVRTNVSSKNLIRNVFFGFIWYKFYFSVFVGISFFLSYLFEYISMFNQVLVNFYAISNNSVTANFLARYMAKRFRQHYSLKELFNPLKRELRYVIRDYRAVSAYIGSKLGVSGKIRAFKRFNYSLLRKSFFFLLNYYSEQHYFYYKKFSFWFTYDLFLVNCWFFNTLYDWLIYLTEQQDIVLFKTHIESRFMEYIPVLRYIFIKYKFLKPWEYFSVPSYFYKNRYYWEICWFFDTDFLPLRSRSIGLFKTYFYRRWYLLFFFNPERSNIYSTELFMTISSPNLYFWTKNKWPDFSFYFEELFDDFYANFSVLFSFTSLSNNKLSSLYYKSFILCCSQMKRLISFDFVKFKYSYLQDKLNLNKRNLRKFKPKGHSGLLGFKFHCKGRFTRKQIAASYWFREGRVSLNTLSANIDYSFVTVPLRNSAISVKVWLYKDNFYNTFYMKLT